MVGRKLVRMSEAVKHPGDEAVTESLRQVTDEIVEEIRHLKIVEAKAPSATGQDNASVTAMFLQAED
eukprot:5796724-Heterocapsa_arctica.AAC.1